ncbi:MAG: hypothetical protein ABSF49_13475 [Roseiarcus sp.]|jgi:hypothetical protein|uniref:hypothetical protein n=1 Tax=Roseiarcus sp. TaxID=1969460 RepID=UPI003C2740A9
MTIPTRNSPRQIDRVGLIRDVFSARQGVKDNDMNVLCPGGGSMIGERLPPRRLSN